MFVSGTAYIFSVYSTYLKSSRHWNQSQLELVGIMLDAGLYAGPIDGILVDIFSTRFNMIFAAICSGSGYFFITLLHGKGSATISAVLMMLAGFGCGLGYTAALATNVKNFRDSERKGTLVSCLVAAFGLSALLFTSIYNLYFDGSVDAFLRFLGIVTFVVYGIGCILCRQVVGSAELEAEPLIGEVPKSQSAMQIILNVFRVIKGLVVDSTFWMLFSVFFLGTGGGLMQINNIGNIVKSLNGSPDPSIVGNAVMVLSLCNGFGRLIISLSDYVSIIEEHFWYWRYF